MERLIKYFVPEKYELDIAIDKEEKTLSGVVQVSGEVKEDEVKFHAVGMEVARVEVDGEATQYEVKDGVLSLSGVRRGLVTISIWYSGHLNENMEGAYLSTYEYEGRTEKIVATQFESHYAREAFPCIDEPEAKAVFELTITTSAEDIVLSNTPVAQEKDGMVSFEPTPRMSTYLLAWVCGKFHGKSVTNAHGVEITTYAALNQDVNSVDFANEVAARSLEFYDDNFGVAYPLKKLTQVALPDFEAGAMENWGLVTYRETMLLAGETATLATKKSVALTVAHELSHQWFGDLVTMRWWDDLWLNESFASVMEYYAVDHCYSEFKIWEGFFTGDALAALRRDCVSGVQAVHQDVNDPAEIATLFDPAIVYAKGARLMLMVIRAMGWEDFCRGIREYFSEFQYGNTVGDDLWRALSKHAKFDVGELMHGFIDRPGYPVLTDTQSGDGDDFVKYAQKRFLIDGEMSESDWMLPEITEDMSGHYILNLSEEEFSGRLSRFDELGLEEKLRLLTDRDLLAKTEMVESASLLPLIAKFSGETSAAVWNIIATIVGGLKVFFERGSEDERRYKKFVKELVAPGLLRVGLETRDGDDENTLRLRANLVALDVYASMYNREGDLGNLRALASRYTADVSSIDAEMRSDILDAKIYLEQEYVDEYLRMYRETADPEVKFDLLFAVTLVDTPEACSKVMSLLDQPDVVKPQDQFYLFIWLYRNPVMREKAFSWLTTHWDYVRQMAGDKSVENYPRYTASSVRSGMEFDEWRRFFSSMRDDPALARAIEVGENEITARLSLVREDAEGVKEKLVKMME